MQATQSIMCAQLYMSNFDKRMKLQAQSMEHHKNQAEEFKKSLEEFELERGSLQSQLST